MRTSGGMGTSRLPSESVVFSDMSACHHSVSLFVCVIFGQVCVVRQRSSWPLLMPDCSSCCGFHVCGDSWPGYCCSVCCVPERRVDCAKRMLNAPRFDALCGIAPS